MTEAPKMARYDGFGNFRWLDPRIHSFFWRLIAMHQFDSEFLLGLVFALATASAPIALPCAIAITLVSTAGFGAGSGGP
jgi:hypothetical protein